MLNVETTTAGAPGFLLPSAPARKRLEDEEISPILIHALGCRMMTPPISPGTESALVLRCDYNCRTLGPGPGHGTEVPHSIRCSYQMKT
jgi:hypothetical protein